LLLGYVLMLRRVVLGGIFFLLIAPVFTTPLTDSQPTTAIIAGPYLQHVTMTEITIRWVTSQSTTENIVQWGSAVSSLSTTKGDPNREWHEILITGLQPETTYVYQVISDEVASAWYTFTTAPENSGDVTIIAYGDSRGVWDNWHNALRVAQAIEKSRPDLVINTGDLVANGLYEEQWIQCFQTATYSHNASLYPVLGNHDLPAAQMAQYCSLPGNEQWYTFDYGESHVVILNSIYPDMLSLSQYLWLIRTLPTEQLWTIVAFHHPPYSSGEHGDTLRTKLLWTPLFNAMGVDIVLNGHDHNYEHLKVNKVHYLVTGGGGAPLYDVGSGPWTLHAESAFHFCRLSCTQDQLQVTAIDVDGRELDSFALAARQPDIAGVPTVPFLILYYAFCSSITPL